MTETIIGYSYEVIVKETVLLVSPKGADIDEADDVDGYNIDLVKYEDWSNGDIVQCDRVTITGTTGTKEEAEYLADIVKTSAAFAMSFESGISQSEAYEKFRSVE